MWSSRCNENWQGKQKYSEKTCPSATLSTINPTWLDLGSNPGRRRKPATNRLSYGTAELNLNNFLYVLVIPQALRLIGSVCLVLKRHSHPQQHNAVMCNTVFIKTVYVSSRSSFCEDNSTNFIRRTGRLFWVPCKAPALLMGRKRIKRIHKYLGTEIKQVSSAYLFIYLWAIKWGRHLPEN
jgi:hypothetical protein